MIEDTIIAEVENVLKGYRYGQFNIAGKELTIQVKPETKQLIIPEFYHNDTSLDYGTCLELREAFCAQNANRFPSLKFQRVVGNDAVYFSNNGSSHCFLIAESTEPGTSHYDFSSMLTIDPSFGKCARFYDSGYSIETFLYEGMNKYPPSKTADLCNHAALPIYLSPKGEIYYITAQFSKENPVQIMIGNPDDKRVLFDLYSDELTSRISDDKDLSEMIYSIRNAKREIVKRTYR